MPPDDVITTRTPTAPCPSCHVIIEAATGTGTPEPGDITMCSCCFVFLKFIDGLALRVLTNAEWKAIQPKNRAVLTQLRDFIRYQRSKGRL